MCMRLATQNAHERFELVCLGGAVLHSDIADGIVVLAAGADLRSRSLDGLRPLHTAVKAEADKVADVLLQRGIDVNGAACEVGTMLHQAVMVNSEHVVGSLLERGETYHRRHCGLLADPPGGATRAHEGARTAGSRR